MAKSKDLEIQEQF